MFVDSLFDSGASSRPRKIWPRVLSFIAEMYAIGLLVLLPLIFTQALPEELWTRILENPTPPLGQAPVKVVHGRRALARAVLRRIRYCGSRATFHGKHKSCPMSRRLSKVHRVWKTSSQEEFLVVYRMP